MRFAASKQSSLRYHFVPPAGLLTRDILRNVLFNQCRLAIRSAINATTISSGIQASKPYAAQKRHPDRGIKYDPGALLYFTCKKITVGSAATNAGQTRIHTQPIVIAMESKSTSRCRHSPLPASVTEPPRPRSKHAGQTCSLPNCKSHSAHTNRPHRWQQAWNDLSGWKKHVAWSESAAAA